MFENFKSSGEERTLIAVSLESVCTDGTPAMIEKRNESTAVLEFFPINLCYCITVPYFRKLCLVKFKNECLYICCC